MITLHRLVHSDEVLHLNPDLIQPQATFAELGVDSLSMVELALILEEQHGIDAEGIDPAGTLAQATTYLERAAGAQAAETEAANIGAGIGVAGADRFRPASDAP